MNKYFNFLPLTLLTLIFISKISWSNKNAFYGPESSAYSKKINRIYKNQLSKHHYNLKKVKQNNHEPQSLRVLTYNLGLLNHWICSVPSYEKRSEYLYYTLGNYLVDERPDILFLQELWYKKDILTIQELSENRGYINALGPNYSISKNMLYGLQILIRKDIISANKKPIFYASPYKYINGHYIRKWYETILGKNVIRGLLWTHVELKNSRILFLGTTHLSATYRAIETRKEQIGELSAMLSLFPKKADYIIIGADFNASPEFENSSKAEKYLWEQNKQTYIDFVEKNPNLLDAYYVSNPDKKGFTQDRRINDLAYWSWTTRDEPEQRIDFIFFGITKYRNNMFNSFTPLIYAKESSLAFDKELFFNGKVLESDLFCLPPKDHNGQNLILESKIVWDIPKYQKSRVFFSDHLGIKAEIILY